MRINSHVKLTQDDLRNHLIQIKTGEGKSIALGFTAVILAALGFSVDVVCYSRYCILQLIIVILLHILVILLPISHSA